MPRLSGTNPLQYPIRLGLAGFEVIIKQDAPDSAPVMLLEWRDDDGRRHQETGPMLNVDQLNLLWLAVEKMQLHQHVLELRGQAKERELV